MKRIIANLNLFSNYSIIYLPILLWLLIPSSGFAQKQQNIWYIGDGAGLDFNHGAPVALTNSQINLTQEIEGTAGICDSSGALLFYTDAMQIWNRNQQVMQNGDSILSNASATQSSLIIPQPGSNNLFYLFTVDDFFRDGLKYGFRYSVIDMCLGNGVGGVVPGEKNILLLDTVTEKLTAVRHQNGTDYWVIVHKFLSDAFYAYLFSAGGISAPVISHIGSIHECNSSYCLSNSNYIELGSAQGQMKASPDGHRIALVADNNYYDLKQLFNFDKATGVVSNFIDLATAEDSTGILRSYYGVSFSPDNSKLYISDMSWRAIYQYDLTAGGGNADSIRNSKAQVANSAETISGIQLGPDGEIYASHAATFLGAVSNPNARGLACNYIDSAVSLNGKNSSYGMPNMIDSYDYSNGLNRGFIAGTLSAVRDTICAGTAANLSLAGNNSNTLQWQSSNSLKGFTGISGARNTTFNKVLDSTTYFRVVVGTGHCADTSNIVKIFVPPLLTAYFNSTQTGANQQTFNPDSSIGDIRYYHWDFGDGQTSNEKNPVHTFPKDSTYYVCLTLYDGSNCSYTFCRYTDITDGVTTVSAQGNWGIYPNPFTDQLTISTKFAPANPSFGGQANGYVQSIKLYDMIGQLLMNKNTGNDSNASIELNTSSLAKGMYYLVIKTSDTDFIEKVVKQ